MRLGALALLGAAGLALAGACSGGPPPQTETSVAECGFLVQYSLANQDRTAPVTMFDLLVDGTPVFHGALQPSLGGDYLYVSNRLPHRKAEIEVRSEARGEQISARKKIWVEDRIWIVITRAREDGEPPEIRIEVSYENPGMLLPPE